ncbi:MAG: hypothetical protein JXA04_09380 [Gammaproteobacteria bacterium]|nr:hypothetical protein [Gammaproteobacteria bacterium]
MKAHNLAWPGEMVDATRGVLATVSERDFIKVRECCKSLRLDEDVFLNLYRIYLQVAAWIVQSKNLTQNADIVGINGAQGTGKTTAAFILKNILEYCFDRKTCILSLDDLYLTRRQRAELARKVHPLLVTRGVPGTHDIGLTIEVLSGLKNAGDGTKTRIPSFDKANDDRRRPEQWGIYSGKPDIILFEGWCVSAVPQPKDDLQQAINQLERLNDHDGAWRQYVNEQLTEYQSLFDLVELLIMLKVPGFKQLYEWRLLQERKLQQDVEINHATSRALMDEEQVKWFIEHFERLTRWMLDEMPARADLVLALNPDHQIKEVILNRA